MKRRRVRVWMRRSVGALVLLISTLIGCFTSFDLSNLPRPPMDGGIDATTPLDGEVGGGCGSLFHPCCVSDASAPSCMGNLVCTGTYCENCPSLFAACGGACTDINLDPENCGACGTACGSHQECSMGVCQTPCPLGQSACGLVCVFTATDPANCGRCSAACSFPHAAGACAAGACVLGACDMGWGNCDGVASNGCETDLTSTVSDCGVCGNACAFAGASGSCSAGVCTRGACAPGYLDCDGVASNGCEVRAGTNAQHCGSCATSCMVSQICSAGVCATPSMMCPTGQTACTGTTCTPLATDPANCGACGNTCAGPNANWGCTGGMCLITSCGTGYGDCDHDPANGCETDLSNTMANCGACGRSCNFANASATCASGACQLGACNAGWGNCDGNAANGCETDLTSTTGNCGACGNACAYANASATCATGICQLGACAAGYANCNGAPGDGCEATLTSDPDNCGVCRNTCSLANSTPLCSGGMCALGMCLAGFAHCEGVATQGCESSLRSDPANCGACGVVCAFPNASAACTGGACALDACNPGFANCDGQAANGCEVALASSPMNCGACGHACAAGSLCSGGTCVRACTGGRTACGGACTDTHDDPSNCGACGHVCPTGVNASATCSNGVCGTVCRPGWGACSSGGPSVCSTSLAADVNNCGACRAVCPSAANASPSCNGGRCGFVCNSGYADCDGNPTNGCEAALNTDVSACGGCSTVCTVPSTGHATPKCTAGACGITCVSGWGDCDGNPANGCETSLTSNAYNCGTCGNRCWFANATSTCASGACQLHACVGYFANCDGDASNGCETELNSNPLNCGACGAVCNPAASLNEQGLCGSDAEGHPLCSTACLPGFANCDGVASNGCEADLRETSNCRRCGNTCASGLCSTAAGCVGSTCLATACVSEGECTSVASDFANCGGCGTRCVTADGATASCNGSACQTVCSSYMANCDANPTNGCEIDTRTSPTNCGACGLSCSAGQYCTQGQCCQVGQVLCGTVCVNLATDSNNCGNCGTHCGTGMVCTQALCGPT